MAETKWTPGPWEQAGTLVWSPPGKACICELSELRPPSGTVEHCRFDVFRETDEARQEAFANARLIAAAPDLYEVAKRVAEMFRDTDAPLAALAHAARPAGGATSLVASPREDWMPGVLTRRRTARGCHARADAQMGLAPNARRRGV